MTRVIKASYLRVYLPEDQIRAWEKHLDSDEPRTRRWEPYGFVGESMIEDALLAEWSGRIYVCPRRPQLRMLEGVLALYHAFDAVGRSGIIPEEVARQADRELRKLKASEPDIRSQILTSAWHVPIRWFVAFVPEEREYLTKGEARPRIRYRTKVHMAKDRVEKAQHTLKKAEIPGNVLPELAQLEQWLDSFPASSMVELDYGGVAELFDAAELVLDDSAAQVQAALVALEGDDLSEATRHYLDLMGRWSTAFAVSYSS